MRDLHSICMSSSIYLERFSWMIHRRMFDYSRFFFVLLSPADYLVNVLLIGTRLFRCQLRLISVMNSITKIERTHRVNLLVRKVNGCVERVSSSSVHPQVVSIDDNDAIALWIVEIKVMKIHVINMFPCRIVRVDRRNVSMENLAIEKTNRHVVSDRRQIERVLYLVACLDGISNCLDDSDEQNCTAEQCHFNRRVYCPRENRCSQRENSYG